MKKLAESIEAFASSSAKLSDYECTDVIATLARREDEVKSRWSVWRTILGLPVRPQEKK